MLDTDCEMVYHRIKEPVEIVMESDYLKLGLIEALRVSGEEYNRCVNTIISSAYSSISIPDSGDVNISE